MKAITQKMLDQKMIGRSIIDRKRKVDTSILAEQRAINREFSSRLTPAALYGYYISICQIATWDLLDDAKVAKQLGYTERSITEARRKLTKAGWIRLHKFTHNNIEYGMWYIGKDVVKANLNTNTTLKELNELGIITDEEYEAQSDLEECCNAKRGLV